MKASWQTWSTNVCAEGERHPYARPGRLSRLRVTSHVAVVAVPSCPCGDETCVVEAQARYNSCGLRSVRRSYEGMIPRNVHLSKEASNAGATRHTGFATTPGASACDMAPGRTRQRCDHASGDHPWPAQPGGTL